MKPSFIVFGFYYELCKVATYQRSVNFKMSFWVLQISQKNNKTFSWISALASKKGQIKKIRALYTPLIGGFLFDSLALLFLFDLSLEARSEILKNFLGFLGDLLSLNILKLTDFLKVR